MTTGSDYLDFTQPVSRLNQQAIESPISASAVGWQAASVTVPQWANSLQIMVVLPTGVISLQALGGASGFTYLSAMPAYDGGLYFIPVLAAIEGVVNFSWYQVTIARVTIYVIASDEPIAIATVNPISPTESFVESPDTGSPYTCIAGATFTQNVIVNITTQAVRCTLNRPTNVHWCKVVGHSSGNVYYDGSATNSVFPATPIPIDAIADPSVDISVNSTVLAPSLLYVSKVDVPDFGGTDAITIPMAPNALAIPKHNAEIPNQQPAVFNGSVGANGTVTLIPAVNNQQIRLHELIILSSGTTLCQMDLQSTGGVSYFRHFSSVAYQLVIPFNGKLLSPNLGLLWKNNLAVASGNFALTLYWSYV